MITGPHTVKLGRRSQWSWHWQVMWTNSPEHWSMTAASDWLTSLQWDTAAAGSYSAAASRHRNWHTHTHTHSTNATLHAQLPSSISVITYTNTHRDNHALKQEHTKLVLRSHESEITYRSHKPHRESVRQWDSNYLLIATKAMWKQLLVEHAVRVITCVEVAVKTAQKQLRTWTKVTATNTDRLRQTHTERQTDRHKQTERQMDT